MGGTGRRPRRPRTPTQVLLFGPGAGAPTELPLIAESRGAEPTRGPARGPRTAREGRARRHFRWGRGLRLRREPRPPRHKPRPPRRRPRPGLLGPASAGWAAASPGRGGGWGALPPALLSPTWACCPRVLKSQDHMRMHTNNLGPNSHVRLCLSLVSW